MRSIWPECSRVSHWIVRFFIDVMIELDHLLACCFAREGKNSVDADVLCMTHSGECHIQLTESEDFRLKIDTIKGHALGFVNRESISKFERILLYSPHCFRIQFLYNVVNLLSVFSENENSVRILPCLLLFLDDRLCDCPGIL